MLRSMDDPESIYSEKMISVPQFLKIMVVCVAGEESWEKG